MSVISIAEVKAKQEKERKTAVRRWRRYRWRHIWQWRSGPHVAYHTYHCDYCIFLISSGEEYEREIWAINAWKRFFTRRRHYPQCYGPSEDEDREIREQIERDRERERAAEQAARKEAA